MALVIITLQDGAQGPSVTVNSEPAMPTNVLQGQPTPAQAAAAIMLNALTAVAGASEDQAANEPSRIITIN